jgi:hypothetical protein
VRVRQRGRGPARRITRGTFYLGHAMDLAVLVPGYATAAMLAGLRGTTSAPLVGHGQPTRPSADRRRRAAATPSDTPWRRRTVGVPAGAAGCCATRQVLGTLVASAKRRAREEAST